jgi:hypothetical protein
MLFEVLTAVVMKSSIFRDITQRSPLKVNQYFGGIYRLHSQVPKKSQARKKSESRWQVKLSSAGFLLGLFFYPEDGGDMSLRNIGLLSTDYTALYPRR